MVMMFRQDSLEETNEKPSLFVVDLELKKHAWHPYINTMEAEQELTGKPAFTYLTRPCEYDRGFMISFVNRDGHIKHDHFTLANAKFGIWRNGHPSHIGKLEKVLRDMMDCGLSEGQPLN